MAAENTPQPGAGRLTEEAAWRLLLAVVPGVHEARDHVTGARLRLAEGGRWSADLPPDHAARDLLDLLLPLATRPAFVVGQLGQSLDGRIATVTGHSHYINGPEDIRRLHRLRALADAVVVGAGTVEADDPRLNVREVEGPNPVRVVLDPRGRLPSDRRVFRDGVAPTLWLRSAGANASAAGMGPGVEAVTLEEGGERGFDPGSVVALLAERGLRRILVEGGGVTVSRFLHAGVLDRLHVSVAPLILGSGRPGLELPPVERLDRALRPPVRHFTLGRDLLFDLDLSKTGG